MAMKHYELLADIDTKILLSEHTIYPIYMQAFRAVVELHKPTNGHDKNICLACSPETPIAYPCPTIQQIIENLK